MKRPFPQIASILSAQLRHKTGEIRIPPEAQEGDYDLVLIASPTWWFQTSMPIRSYLESPGAKAVLDGKPFACASISRRYYSINLRQQKKLAEKNGGRFVDKTHFVVAGGQVKSMLSWLGYMKHGEPQDARLRAEDAAAEPQARLRGAGEELRGRRRRRGAGAAGVRRRGELDDGPLTRPLKKQRGIGMTAMTVFALAAFGAAVLARSRAARARPAPIVVRRRRDGPDVRR